MKNNIKRQFYRNLITTLAIYTLVGIAAIFIATIIYSTYIWYGYELIYFFFTRIGPLLATLYFTVGYIFILAYYYNRLLNNIQTIYDSVNLVNADNSDYISLPSDIGSFESGLNEMKVTIRENRRLAEAEEERKNDLIVYLAHDIKTPLTSIIGYLSLLDEVKDMPSLQREKYLSVVLDKAFNLEDLINELFDIARYNDGKMTLYKEEINLNLMLSQIVDDFYPTLQSQNKEVKIITNDSYSIFVDSEKIARVINNVLNNAINYSDRDTTIKIVVMKDENYTNIAISNIGREISKEKLNQIFEKFYRLDSSRSSATGGSGLGLAIAKDIIELHDGDINAISNNKETTFIIRIP